MNEEREKLIKKNVILSYLDSWKKRDGNGYLLLVDIDEDSLVKLVQCATNREMTPQDLAARMLTKAIDEMEIESEYKMIR